MNRIETRLIHLTLAQILEIITKAKHKQNVYFFFAARVCVYVLWYTSARSNACAFIPINSVE